MEITRLIFRKLCTSSYNQKITIKLIGLKKICLWTVEPGFKRKGSQKVHFFLSSFLSFFSLMWLHIPIRFLSYIHNFPLYWAAWYSINPSWSSYLNNEPVKWVKNQNRAKFLSDSNVAANWNKWRFLSDPAHVEEYRICLFNWFKYKIKLQQANNQISGLVTKQIQLTSLL